MAQEDDKKRIDRLFNDAAAKNDERLNKRGAELFAKLDGVIADEVHNGGPIDSASHWAALATLIAKTVMVQEFQTGRTDTFDESARGVIEAARAVYKGGFNILGDK